MLRLLIGCLALVGLATLLIIGGCVGLIAFGVKKGMEVPARAKAERLKADHGPLLEDLAQRLGKPDGLAGMPSRPALVAVRVRGAGSDADDIDLLTMRPQHWRWHTLINGGGIGMVETGGKEVACLIYVLERAGQTYWIYLADPGPAAPAPPPKPADRA